VVSQEQLQQLDKEQVNIADFVVVVPADMIKSY
jgi:hypothetical protein